MLIVSAGDVYGGRDAYNRPKCQFIARMMESFGYDAVALGEMDLSFGLDAIVEDSRTYRMNMICANVFPKQPSGARTPASGVSQSAAGNETVFPPYRILDKGGVRFGIIALLSPALKNAKAASETGDVEALTYVVKAPGPVLEKFLPEVRAKAEVVVLLAHMERSEVEPILASTTGIDMVILGHSGKPQVTPEPTLAGNVPIYMASHQGQYLGRAVLSLDSNGKITGSSNAVRLLDSTVADDPEVARAVRDFEAENRKYQKEIFVKEQLQAAAGAPGAGEVYLGLSNCQRCHSEAFDAYIGTKHARAYATLSAMYMQRDSGCIPCHSTGYGAPGGFTGTRVAGSSVDLVDVQCEACHGPGAEHSRDGRYRETAKAACVRCHTAEQTPDFDYAKAWAKIVH